jgi:hypothetical protein
MRGRDGCVFAWEADETFSKLDEASLVPRRRPVDQTLASAQNQFALPSAGMYNLDTLVSRIYT